MGIFTKEQNVKIIRDEYGQVIRLEKTGSRMGESRTPISDKLLAQQPQQAQPKKKPSRFIGFAKKVDKAIVNYNRNRNPLGTGGRRPGPSNANPFGSVFDTGISYPKSTGGRSKTSTKYVVIEGVAYPKAKKKKSKGKGKGKRGGGSPEIFNFDFGVDNWGTGF